MSVLINVSKDVVPGKIWIELVDTEILLLLVGVSDGVKVTSY